MTGLVATGHLDRFTDVSAGAFCHRRGHGNNAMPPPLGPPPPPLLAVVVREEGRPKQSTYTEEVREGLGGAIGHTIERERLEAAAVVGDTRQPDVGDVCCCA